MTGPDRPADLAEDVVDRLRACGLTVAVAESVTGGRLMAALTDVPGVSAVLRGGPVVYMTDTKQSRLGVPGDLLDERGPVDPDVATAMATAVRERWGADIGVATTGVAGPDPQDHHPVGEVYVAVVSADRREVSRPEIAPGSGRAAIRTSTVEHALCLLAGFLERGGGREAAGGRRGYTEVTQGEERR